MQSAIAKRLANPGSALISSLSHLYRICFIAIQYRDRVVRIRLNQWALDRIVLISDISVQRILHSVFLQRERVTDG